MPCDVQDRISRNHAGPQRIALRRRTGYNGQGQGEHAPQAAVDINQTFYQKVSDWAVDFDETSNQNLANDGRIGWLGQIGIIGHCEDSGFSWHQRGRAFDLTRVHFMNDSLMDSNWSWRQSGTFHKRRYHAVTTSLRRYFSTVITQWYNSDHDDHIHFDDDGHGVRPLDRGSRADTTIVQSACNLFDNASLVVDGNWGPATENRFDQLIGALKIRCFDSVFSSLPSTRLFLNLLSVRGLRNENASEGFDYCD